MHGKRIRNVENILCDFNREKCYTIICVQNLLEKPIITDHMLRVFYSVTYEINDTIYENMIRLNVKLKYYFAIGSINNI